MATIGFGLPDLELLGYSNPKALPQAVSSEWTVYSATAVAGIEEIETRFIYLKSGCTVEDAKTAARGISGPGRRYVIKPRSLRIGDDTLRLIFGKDVPIHVHETLVWDKIYNTFHDYIDSLGVVPVEKYYVLPRSSDAAVGDSLGEKMLEFLSGSNSSDDGKLLVVCANAGVGKTTLARYLVHELRKRVVRNRTIPIFVEAQHWGRIHLDSIESLWEIIDNSLRTFAHELRIREDLFQYALQQGYLCFIFDGFDELCGRRVSNFVPSEMLHNISVIAEQSAGRVLITTRTLYWKAEISDPPSNVSLFQVDAFNTQQAKGYFAKYFPDDPNARSRAAGVYKRLVDGSFRPKEEGGTRAQFVNLPLCVAMIAEYVRSGGQDLDVKNSRQLIDDLITDICQREVERKQLDTKARDQLRALQEIAVLDSSRINPEFELDMLEAAGVDSKDLKKMIDHPLLDSIGQNSFRLKFDFLGPYLRSLYVANAIANQSESLPRSVVDLLKQEANGKGFMLEHLTMFLGSEGLDNVGKAYRAVPSADYDARSFLVHLAQALVEVDPSITTQSERTALLFNALDESFETTRVLRGLSVTGTLEGLDLSGVRFEACRFHDAGFRRCKANGATLFHKSVFSGELLFDFASGEKTGWSDVQLNECSVAFPASAVWEDVRGSATAPWDEQVMDALRIALGKFWYHGRPKASIQFADWNKGVLRHLNLCKPILESMLRHELLEQINIGGVSEGGLALAKDSVGDLQRFMDNQQLGGKIRKVCDDLLANGRP